MRRCSHQPYEPSGRRPHNTLTTQGNFRLIRAFDIDHNIRRLKAYTRRLGRDPASLALRRRTRLKRRIKAGTGQANA